MTDKIEIFKSKVQEVINDLSDEQYANYKKAETHEERVKSIFTSISHFQSKPKGSGKNYGEARKAQEAGNSFFKKKDSFKAIERYSSGIIICPQNSEEEKELHSILIANRSAALYEEQKYQESINDIDYTLSTSSYPKHLSHKILTRKGKCLIYIKDSLEKVLETLKLAEKSLDEAKLNPTDISKKREEISMLVQEAKKVCPNLNAVANVNTNDKSLKVLVSNPYYLSAHASMSVKKDDIQGRYAYAIDDIDAGTVLIREKGHCAVLAAEYSLKNCQNCMRATKVPIACPNCSRVIFCSLKCMNEAVSSYHKIECGILPDLFESGVSINCFMALRIITQRDVEYFYKKLNHPQRINRYDPSDYALVYDLCRHEESKSLKEYLYLTVMAVYLLSLLKSTEFFTKPNEKDEVFIGQLILRHLLMLQYNAHEISEVQEVYTGPTVPKIGQDFQSNYIGGGLYPTIALFNHSCDPTIIRFNIGSEMIVRTIKPVKEGEILYENYGPLYMNTKKDDRQSKLEESYKFTCNCKPCLEDWPLCEEMQDNIITVPCSNPKCHDMFCLMDNFCQPLVTCSSCKKQTNILMYLAALKKLEDILAEAEKFYANEKYKQAEIKFLEAIRIYAKCTVPPLPDWIKVQQRLRTCMIIEGNKCIEYSEKFDKSL